MDNANPPVEIVSFAGQFIQKTAKVHLNIEENFIFTTEDKIRLCLIEHLSRMERSKAWITPLGIFLTILVVFPTASFHNVLFVKAEIWEAIFIISFVTTQA